jgi:hypothetical protein
MSKILSKLLSVKILVYLTKITRRAIFIGQGCRAFQGLANLTQGKPWDTKAGGR